MLHSLLKVKNVGPNFLRAQNPRRYITVTQILFTPLHGSTIAQPQRYVEKSYGI